MIDEKLQEKLLSEQNSWKKNVSVSMEKCVTWGGKMCHLQKWANPYE